jgi:hypothetical protein
MADKGLEWLAASNKELKMADEELMMAGLA